jgi:hypothetical protein
LWIRGGLKIFAGSPLPGLEPRHSRVLWQPGLEASLNKSQRCKKLSGRPCYEAEIRNASANRE